MKTYAVIFVGAAVLLMLWLTGCTDAPSSCGGESLSTLQAKAQGKYEVIYDDNLPRGILGTTVRLQDGPAIVHIASDLNRISRDGALAHELGCHVLGNISHPPKPPPSNLAKPIGPGYWDRFYMGMPQ